ncbi:MAG: PilZ domain-containing protein [Nitrospirae bacterium]|nr:PilZ domain-containing protein [Nitrospirota bacterium]
MERRKYIRFEIPLDVIFKRSNNGDRYSEGVTKNFSRDGCCIESRAIDLTMNTPVDLRVRHPLKNVFVSICGDVVWKHQISAGWTAGIKFSDMDKEAKSEILDQAYNLWVERMREIKRE